MPPKPCPTSLWDIPEPGLAWLLLTLSTSLTRAAPRGAQLRHFSLKPVSKRLPCPLWCRGPCTMPCPMAGSSSRPGRCSPPRPREAAPVFPKPCVVSQAASRSCVPCPNWKQHKPTPAMFLVFIRCWAQGGDGHPHGGPTVGTASCTGVHGVTQRRP